MTQHGVARAIHIRRWAHFLLHTLFTHERRGRAEIPLVGCRYRQIFWFNKRGHSHALRILVPGVCLPHSLTAHVILIFFIPITSIIQGDYSVQGQVRAGENRDGYVVAGAMKCSSIHVLVYKAWGGCMICPHILGHVQRR